MDMEKRKEEILQKLLEENRQDGAYVPDADWAEQAQDDARLDRTAGNLHPPVAPRRDSRSKSRTTEETCVRNHPHVKQN